MNYNIDKLNITNMCYEFVFDDGQWTEINLDKYPNYEVVENYIGLPYWYFIVESSNNPSIQNESVYKFKFDEIYKYGTNLKKFQKNNVVYRKATQTEYDKFMSNEDKNNSNGKIFEYLKELYDNSKKKIKTTLII